MARSTSKDVARLAGVSQATVSMVLNDEQGRRFTEDTRLKVQQAAAELGYLPSRTARALRLGRSDDIVLLVPDTPSGANGAARAANLMDEVAALGYDLVWRRLRTGDPMSVLWEPPAPAAIIGPEIPAQVDLDAMRAAGVVPLFLDMTEVNGRIGRLQVTHLAERGHRRLGYVGPADPASQSFASARLAGARAACSDLGLPEPCCEYITIDTVDAGRSIGQLRARGVTGLIAYNDDHALAALAGARSQQVDVPADLAVIGVDDSALGRVWDPALSSVSLREDGLLQAIAHLRSDSPTDHHRVVLTLVQREST